MLDRNFAAPTTPDKIWCVDITYIPTDEGFLYMAGVMDLQSQDRGVTHGRLAGDRPGRERVQRCGSVFGPLHYSDCGVQYTSERYRGLLDLRENTVSMSRTGDCYDHALVESVWGKLKTEMVHHE